MTAEVRDISTGRRRRTRESVAAAEPEATTSAEEAAESTDEPEAAAPPKAQRKPPVKTSRGKKPAAKKPARPKPGKVTISGTGATLPVSDRQESVYDKLLETLIVKTRKLKKDQWVTLDLKGRRPNTVQSGLAGSARFRGKTKVSTRVRTIDGVETLFVRAVEVE